MLLTKRQNAAINAIIQEEVQGALKGRSLVAEHMRRAKLFEEVGSYEVVEARAKAEEAAFLLGEARDLLEHDEKLHKQANEAHEKAYELMGALDEELGDEDEADGPPDMGYPPGPGERIAKRKGKSNESDDDMDESYGDELDEDGMMDMLPMHPRAHAERPGSGKKAPPASAPGPHGDRPEPARGYGRDDGSEVKLPPRHPRAR